MPQHRRLTPIASLPMQRCVLASPANRSLLLDVQKQRRLQHKTLSGPLDDSIYMLRPIVQHTWIEFRPVRRYPVS